MALRHTIRRAGGFVRNRIFEWSCRRSYEKFCQHVDDTALVTESMTYCAHSCAPGAIRFIRLHVWKEATSDMRTAPELISFSFELPQPRIPSLQNLRTVHTCPSSLHPHTTALHTIPAPTPVYPIHSHDHSRVPPFDTRNTIMFPPTSSPRTYSTSVQKLPGKLPAASTPSWPNSAENDASAEPYDGDGPSVPPDHSVAAEEVGGLGETGWNK